MSKSKGKTRKPGIEEDHGRIPPDIQHREKKGARKRTREVLSGIRSLSDVFEDDPDGNLEDIDE
jgi:hypothetical protein